MCLIFIAYQYNPYFPLIIAANRDEFHQRPTQAAGYWEDHPGVLAGRDLKQGGTWLGVNKSGKLAAITNIRRPDQQRDDAQSRGSLTRSFLTKDTAIGHFGNELQASFNHYNGFNLLYGDHARLMYFSSDTGIPEAIPPGCHGLSNAQLNTPWPKVQQGTQQFAQLTREVVGESDLFELLSDRSIAPDQRLPDTGISLEMERMLSSKFIVSPHYGTRASTLLSISIEGHVTFIEQNFLTNGEPGERRRFCYSLV